MYLWMYSRPPLSMVHAISYNGFCCIIYHEGTLPDPKGSLSTVTFCQVVAEANHEAIHGKKRRCAIHAKGAAEVDKPCRFHHSRLQHHSFVPAVSQSS